MLHYQPIVSLRGRARLPLRGAAAPRRRARRARWSRPGAFLPAAERYGLIREIDRMVLARVAALLGLATRDGAA